MQVAYKHFTWFLLYIGNRIVPGFADQEYPDAIRMLPQRRKKRSCSRLVITYGGHIPSGQQSFAKHPPGEQLACLIGWVADLFGSLTTVIEMDAFEFLEKTLARNAIIRRPGIYKSRKSAGADIRAWSSGNGGDRWFDTLLPAESACIWE